MHTSATDALARVADLAAGVAPVDARAGDAARGRWDLLAMPPGSLGRLQELGARLAAMARRCPPPAPERAVLVVCAGDHGVVSQGASIWPAEVTAAMVATICAGGAAANAIAAAVGCEIVVLDAGVRTPPAPHPRLRGGGRGATADLTRGPAMPVGDAAAAILAGAGVAGEEAAGGADVLVTGDMGIGNTTAAACLVAGMTGADPDEVTGLGAGGGADHLARKRALVRRGLARHRPDPAEPLAVLAALGGREHAALVGVVLGAAAAGRPVLLDGVNAVAAALVATALCPAAREYLVAGHRSVEPGAGAGLEALGLEPLVDLGLRLGEGTGALLALPMLRAAARALAGMDTLEDVAGGR